MTILGIDHGSKRVGLAVGDTSTLMVFPLRSIEREGMNDDQLIAEIMEIAKTEGAAHFVIGMPGSMRHGEAASKVETAVRAFVDKFKTKTSLTVDTEDERMSSKAADRKRIMLGVSKKKFDRDAVAAAEILQTYVERHFRHDDIEWRKE